MIIRFLEMKLGVTFLKKGRQWLIVEFVHPYINLFCVKGLDDTSSEMKLSTPSHASFGP
jgi:hypothetical protein